MPEIMTAEDVFFNATGRRIAALDVLRGFAVMGILAMNIGAFALPAMAYFSPVIAGGDGVGDKLSWLVSFILIDGKMRGLFTLLFGASMMLIIMRAEGTGQNAGKIHYSRMFWLCLFGLCHYYFIWWGDILFLYALAGSLAFLFARLHPQQLIILALVTYFVGTLVLGIIFGGMFWEEGLANENNGLSAEIAMNMELEAELYRSGYLSILNYKMGDGLIDPLAPAALYFLETLPLILIGMALMKNGWITGGRAISFYPKWALVGILLGGAGYVLLAVIAASAQYEIILMMNIGIVWSMPFRLIMTLGYAALGLWLVKECMARGGMAERILSHVGAAGRTAFTNYIATSIIMTSIFYGYGLGLYGQVDRSGLWLFFAIGCLCMLAWPKLWLNHFNYGPLEWVWRRLSRGDAVLLRR